MSRGDQRRGDGSWAAASLLRRLPVPLRRVLYRIAYVGLRVMSQLLRPRTRGVKVLVARDGAVLLVRHSYGPRQWDLSGGFCRRGEDFAAAARREAGEELGVRIVAMTELARVPRIHYGRRETLGLFRIDIGDGALTVDSGELLEVRWFGRDALPSPRSELVDLVLAHDAAKAPAAGG